VEVVAGRVGLEASLRLAFTGAHGAFYIMLPDEQSLPEKKIGEATTMARAAKAAGLQHVVWATLEDTSQPPVDEEELTPALGPDGGKARKVDVKAETSKVFSSLGVPTTYLQASWHAAVVTGKWAEEIGKCAYGIFRSPELLNKTVSIDAGLLALELARATGGVGPTPEGRLRTRKLMIGGGAAALALVLVLALVLGHRSDPQKSEVASASAAVATNTVPEPPAPAIAPTPSPSPRPKVVPFNSHGLRSPVAAPAARPQPEHEPAQMAMRSAPLPAASRTRGHPRRFASRKVGKEESESGLDEQPRAIPAEPVAALHTTPAADVRKQPEARKPAPEPAPTPEPEADAPRPVERTRETRTPAVPSKPAASAGAEPSALPAGTVDPKSVASTVRAHASEVQACFERALMDAGGGADLHGHLNVSASIDPTGHVISVWPTSTIEGGSRLQACVLAAFKDWVFAPPAGGVKGRIKYSFSFE
jgi:hypothetical protein